MSTETHLHWTWRDDYRTAQLRLARVRLEGRHAGACRLSDKCLYVRVYVNGHIGYSTRWANGTVSSSGAVSGGLPNWDANVRVNSEVRLKVQTQLEELFSAHLAARALQGYAVKFSHSTFTLCERCPAVVAWNAAKRQARRLKLEGPEKGELRWVGF